jgi:hypothetical protein
MRKITATANDASKREAFLNALKDQSQTFVQVLVDQVGLQESEAHYLRTYWFNPRIGDQRIFWPDKQPIEPIVRHGLIKALELAIEYVLPTDYYWISSAQQFEVYIVVSPYQVTHFILSPPPPDGPTRALATDASIWAIKGGSGSETPGQQAPGQTVESMLMYTVDIQVPVVTSRLQQLS